MKATTWTTISAAVAFAARVGGRRPRAERRARDRGTHRLPPRTRGGEFPARSRAEALTRDRVTRGQDILSRGSCAAPTATFRFKSRARRRVLSRDPLSAVRHSRTRIVARARFSAATNERSHRSSREADRTAGRLASRGWIARGDRGRARSREAPRERKNTDRDHEARAVPPEALTRDVHHRAEERDGRARDDHGCVVAQTRGVSSIGAPRATCSRRARLARFSEINPKFEDGALANDRSPLPLSSPRDPSRRPSR